MTVMQKGLLTLGSFAVWLCVSKRSRAVCSWDKELGRREPEPDIAGFVFSALLLTSKLSDLSISQSSHFKKIPFFLPWLLFPALSKTLLSVLLVRGHLYDTCSASQFPFHFIFFLLFPAPGLLLIPASPELTQQQGGRVAQQLISVPLLLWWSSRDAVRAGQPCKHQPPFSFPPPALRPHSASQFHTDLPNSAPSSHSGALSSALLPQGFSMNQQLSPSFQRKYNLFFALNVLWRSYISPKKSRAELQSWVS